MEGVTTARFRKATAMETHRRRRMRRQRVRRVLAAFTALGTVALGFGFASPASAFNTHNGRTDAQGNASNEACQHSYFNDSGTASAASNDTVNSNEGFC
jgi:hypothetical protein